MPRDTRAEFLSQLEKAAPDIAAAFRHAIDDIKSTVVLSQLIEAIERQDVPAILNLLNLGPEFFFPLDQAINAHYTAAAVAQIDMLPRVIPNTSKVLAIRFNAYHPRAVAYSRERSAELVREISTDTRQMVQEVITEGARTNTAPRTLALRIIGKSDLKGNRTGGLLGLTIQQAQYVENMRRELRDPERLSGYFDRKRRDRRFDPLVNAAIKAGRPVPEEAIERITHRYSDRLLQLRGETIGRTEALRAINAGKFEASLQLVDKGEVPLHAISHRWVATPSERTRDTHAAMHGQVRPLENPFQSPRGAMLMYPGDTSLGAPGEEVINCRCSAHTVIDWVEVARNRGTLPRAA